MESDNPLVQASVHAPRLGEADGVRPRCGRGDIESAIDRFEAILGEAPSNADVRQALSLSHALLGDSDAAIREARLAVDWLPRRVLGPVAVENLAAVYALVDRTDDALKQIERLLAMDYVNSLTVHRLRYEFQIGPAAG